MQGLNDYFEQTTGHIFDQDGVVIKFIGDAIFAAWGAPVADPQAPLKAARACVESGSQDDNPWWSRRNQVDEPGSGSILVKSLLATSAVAGGVDYTMIGDAVNLAARLEGLSKIFGTQILISEEVQSRVGW